MLFIWKIENYNAPPISINITRHFRRYLNGISGKILNFFFWYIYINKS